MDEWVEYIGEGFDTEPKTIAEIEAKSVQTGIRTSIFGGWLVYSGFSAVIKTIRFILNILRRLNRMFRRKKKEVVQLPSLQPVPYPYVDPRLLPQQFQPQPPAQPQSAAQPQPVQPPAQPQPNLSVYMPPQQQPVQPQQPEPQQRYELATNPINGIILFMRELDTRIGYIEEHIDEIITRLNMVQGITPMPERRVRFTSTRS